VNFHVRDPAGPFAQGLRSGMYRPFQRATSIRPIRATGGIEPTGMIKAMVAERRYTWDVALISKSAHLNLMREDGGYLELLELTPAQFASLPALYCSPYFAGNDVYAMVTGYRADHFAGRKAPRHWADFWNVADFPGRRALRRHPIDTLEQALLADGVGPHALYPLDVDRAFASLDRIRPHVDVWWTEAAESSQLLASGQVQMCATTSIRVQKVIDAGAPVAIAWGQNIRSCEGWVILKDTPRLELCRRFVAFACDAARQAVFARHVNSSPTLPGAAALIAADRRAAMPDAHRDGAVESDAGYWSREKDPLIDRFEAWFAGSKSQ
jgi:putative spermidine/putrescine transport system substrate-binding protein